jgi:hypothetical protein
MARPRHQARLPCIGLYLRDDNSLVTTPAALAQGSFQVCVKIDDAVTTDNILVEDILTFVVSQPSNGASSDLRPSRTASPTLDRQDLSREWYL